MGNRLRPIAAMVAAALMVALPARAQDVGSSVAFEGVGFSFDQLLGTSVAIINVTQPPAEGPGAGEPDIAHLSFSLSHVRAERATVPGPWRSDGVVSAYRTADLEGGNLAGEQLDQLQTLLEERPDLAGFMVASPNLDDQPLPYLPVASAAQLFRARAEYIDTPQVSGVAYVTGFAQDLTRFAASDFWYTFQGLSSDGTWYVAVSWVLTADGFPERVGGGAPAPDAYATYLNRTIARLNRAGPEDFSPPLTSLDALVRSFTFEGVPAREPSPLPSPSASPGG